MALTILSAKNFAVKLKATIQMTGRLGFTESTAIHLKLDTYRYVKFALDDETEELFLCLSEESNVDSFKVRLSGKYYYVPTTSLFDKLGYDYKKKTIMFDLVRFSDYDNMMTGVVYKMCKRENIKKEL